MAMTVQIDLATGAGPSYAATTAVKWNRADSEAGTTAIPTPTFSKFTRRFCSCNDESLLPTNPTGPDRPRDPRLVRAPTPLRRLYG